VKNSPIKIGDKIELVHEASALNRALSENKYTSQVLEFDGIRTLKVSMPIFEGKIIPLEVGDDYHMVFFSGTGLYQCSGRVRKRYVEKMIHVMDIVLLTSVKKYQRRQFYRLDCTIPIKFRVLTEEELNRDENSDENNAEVESKQEVVKWLDAIMTDLSGGGMRFRYKGENVEENEVVEIRLFLDLPTGREPVVFRMRIIEASNYQGSVMTHEIRGEYENVDEKDRDLVIKYIFQEQRRRIRKE